MRRGNYRLGRVLMLGTAIIVTIGCAWLTVALWENGESGAEQANVLALPLAIVSLAMTFVSAWLAVKALEPSPDLGEYARELAATVRRERQQLLDGCDLQRDPDRPTCIAG
jgi:hypothetical protein